MRQPAALLLLLHAANVTVAVRDARRDAGNARSKWLSLTSPGPRPTTYLPVMPETQAPGRPRPMRQPSDVRGIGSWWRR